MQVTTAPWVPYWPRSYFPAGPAGPPTSSTDVSLRWKPRPEGPHLVVTRGDLTEARVEAIVSAAGRSLLYSSGVGAAILAKGGPVLATGCQAWIDQHGILSVGQAMTTLAGKLPCSFVIHAVGPAAHNAKPTQEQAKRLRNAVRCVFREADRLQLTSVALPGISTGNKGYPAKLAAKEIVSMCVEYACKSASNTTLRTIVLMDVDTPMHCSFKQALLIAAISTGCSAMVQKARGPITNFQNAGKLLKKTNLDLRLLSPTPFEFLSPDHADYKRILAELPDDFACRVVNVRRVQAPVRKLAYEAMKTVLEGTLVKEMETLYHGTTDRWRASAIALNGFDLSIVTHGRSYGDGVYTSTEVGTALFYMGHSGSLLRLRGLVSNTTIINRDVHVFPDPAALLSVTIVDYAAEDEQDRKQTQGR